MSDKLKEFISKNEAKFDALPQNGHFERFKKRQEKSTLSEPKAANFKWVMTKIAAVFILVLGVSFLFFNLGKMQATTDLVAEVSAVEKYGEDLTEVEVFFTEKVNLKRDEVLAYAGTNNRATSKILMELDKLELQYIDLKKELLMNDNNPQIINAMVENYRTRFSLLERLLEQLKKSNTIKQKHHEQV
ncbi:MAG: hypothetical protein ACI85Q_001888 [Salibacteraceae bacterium]|jgi:hypothetical protein